MTCAGITVPSSQAQEELIRKTYAAAGLDFKDTQYFEAHGTGSLCRCIQRENSTEG
jgi:acyl transferase domain-containing protein